MNVYWVAAAWMAMALVELVVGAVVGNIPAREHIVFRTEFTTFLATLGSGC